MPRDPAASSVKTKGPTYEEAVVELEQLVQRMEDGQLPLDQLLDAYKRGAELLECCRARLAAVEEQVKVLDNGQLKPWSSAQE